MTQVRSSSPAGFLSEQGARPGRRPEDRPLSPTRHRACTGSPTRGNTAATVTCSHGLTTIGGAATEPTPTRDTRTASGPTGIRGHGGTAGVPMAGGGTTIMWDLDTGGKVTGLQPTAKTVGLGPIPAPGPASTIPRLRDTCLAAMRRPGSSRLQRSHAHEGNGCHWSSPAYAGLGPVPPRPFGLFLTALMPYHGPRSRQSPPTEPVRSCRR